jgi:UDP-N-acetylmuramate dehydrogenase
MKIRENVPIAELTTMRMGGFARYVVEITTVNDIVEAYKFADEKGLPTYILGGGSNTIGRDEGFDGVILLNKLRGIDVLGDDGETVTVQAMAGEKLDDLAAFTVERDLTGIEAMSAIPGTVGAAPVQNVGAYGQDIGAVLVSVEAFDTELRDFITLSVKELGFRYRRSILNSDMKKRFFVTAVTVRLRRGEIAGELYRSLQAYLDENGIADRRPATIRDAVIAVRAGKIPNPMKIASSGSFFKNVSVDEAEIDGLRAKFPNIPIYKIGESWEVAAGWLIEQTGLKGQLLHGMRVSDKAALILINESAGNYADLAAARAAIVAAVRDKFGLELEQEPEEI